MRGLSTEDGAATLTEITAKSIALSRSFFSELPKTWILSGGGRRNKTLVQRLKEHLAPAKVELVEALGCDGDFLEAQAFAFLAVRSCKELPLSFPSTTGVPYPMTGGILHEPTA